MGLKVFLSVLVLACVLICCVPVAASSYAVSLQRLTSAPIVSRQTMSEYDFNYNSAYFSLKNASRPSVVIDCLVVRVQNLTEPHFGGRRLRGRSGVGFTTPSALAIACGTTTKVPFGPISQKNVIISEKSDIWHALGAEDPRVIYHPKTNLLFMYYTAVNNVTAPANPKGDVRAMLALAVCNLTASPDAMQWKIVGPILPDIRWSKSAAIIFRDHLPHYLLWGDESICLAYTWDLVHYTPTNSCILTTRHDHFDSELVESGPEPLLMADGNLLFIYNSARKYNDTTPNPEWNLQYNVGWAVLSGVDPRVVVARSEVPILSPVLPWETCNNASGVVGLTPNVVFIEGAKPLGPNQWVLYYQGCDSWTGIALLTVEIKK